MVIRTINTINSEEDVYHFGMGILSEGELKINAALF